MDIVTTAIISGAVYDIFKNSIRFTKKKIKEKLSNVIANDDFLEFYFPEIFIKC